MNGAGRLREAFGEYRAPTGVGRAMRNDVTGLDDVRADVDRVSRKLGRRLTLPGRQTTRASMAIQWSRADRGACPRCRNAGGVTRASASRRKRSIDAARKRKAHVIGLSVLSGSHLPLVEDVVDRMKRSGSSDVPVIVGGIIPPEDAAGLEKAGVAAVYTPKDFELNRIMSDVVRIVERV